ncbi:MAG: helix-turn-helix domain-containing protein [Actinobacteria bacterium]|nr:MAG: helix-turn-helix domain-containing protein [Actinomycetota bacterium]
MSERALFVRLPAAEADRLDRARLELKQAKREIVRELVAQHLDEVRAAHKHRVLAGLKGGRVVVDVPDEGVAVGRHSFRAGEAPEVLSLSQAAELLAVEEAVVRELAEGGDLPARKLGNEWRFSRAALLAWLGGEPNSPAR